MPNDFQTGQETTSHSTVVAGLQDLDDRHFYARCQDLAGGRDPDADESSTHLRVLGPTDGGYPRIANVYGHYSPDSAQLLAGYDLFIPSWLPDPASQAAAIRAANPNAKILRNQNATMGALDLDPLTTEWWNSRPGDPGYNCLLRDSHQQILIVGGWGHPMYNMTEPYCRDRLVQKNVEDFLSSQPALGADLAYDGIFWDGLGGRISWLGSDIDSNLDGQPDAPNVLDAAYQAGVEAFLAQVRARLPYVILVGNGSPQEYAPWINGRLFETEVVGLLAGVGGLTWNQVAADYRDWTGRGQLPHMTFIQSAPEVLFSEKFPFQSPDPMPAAMEAEAAASYPRMRYGLTTSLMGDGLFSYDLGAVLHGQLWWYDEFGVAAGSHSATLPPRGYLGQPTGEPRLLVDTLDTPDQIINGGFEDRLNDWKWGVDRRGGADASLDVDATGGVSGSAAAHIAVTRVADPWSVLLYQPHLDTVAGQSYTLSFWARSDVTRTLYSKISMGASPGTDYGFHAQALVTPEWQHLRLWDVAEVTAGDGALYLQVGEGVGELWLDDVQLQPGALGVWARPFSNGLAVINTTLETQTVSLPGVYCKLNGSQAPLFQARVDDDAAQATAGWRQEAANQRQFGPTVHVTAAGSAATLTYTPTLAHSGMYEVLAWVDPASGQSSAVSVTIRHAEGEAPVLLDQTAGAVGWQSLGAYDFNAGDGGSAVLSATGDGDVVADAFKWVSAARYNDGARVNQIALQPQDGIILLSTCYQPDPADYLPVITRRR